MPPKTQRIIETPPVAATAPATADDAATEVQEEPVEKFPTLRPIFNKLQQEREGLVAQAEPLRQQREALVAKIQPLEAQLREIDSQIKAVLHPRLGNLDNEIGTLAKAMGGRAISESTEGDTQ